MPPYTRMRAGMEVCFARVQDLIAVLTAGAA